MSKRKFDYVSDCPEFAQEVYHAAKGVWFEVEPLPEAPKVRAKFAPLARTVEISPEQHEQNVIDHMVNYNVIPGTRTREKMGLDTTPLSRSEYHDLCMVFRLMMSTANGSQRQLLTSLALTTDYIH